jgi:hypothetical protein
MLHKGFNIEPSERQPGHWHATVTHPGGPLECNGKQVDRKRRGGSRIDLS